MIEVLPVESRAARRRFIDFPYAKYGRDPHWSPPIRFAEWERLDPRKNPFFENAEIQPFLAVDHGRVCGRIAGIDDRAHNRAHGEDAAGFGFFEADSEDVARSLLGAFERWARDRGRTSARGPVNPSLNDHCGLLIDGFDTPPFVLMPHNPPEYAGFLERAGYSKAKDLYAWVVDLQARGGALRRIGAHFAGRDGVVVRPLDFSRLKHEMAAIHSIYCRTWQGNWGFVPPTAREFAHTATALTQIADPRFVLCAEVSGTLAAFAVAVPDINQALAGTNGRLFPLGLFRLLTRRRRINQLRLLLIGVLPEYRWSSLFLAMLCEMARLAAHGPYRRMECSWVLEDNDSVNWSAATAGGTRHKTYRLYQKALR